MIITSKKLLALIGLGLLLMPAVVNAKTSLKTVNQIVSDSPDSRVVITFDNSNQQTLAGYSTVSGSCNTVPASDLTQNQAGSAINLQDGSSLGLGSSLNMEQLLSQGAGCLSLKFGVVSHQAQLAVVNQLPLPTIKVAITQPISLNAPLVSSTQPVVDYNFAFPWNLGLAVVLFSLISQKANRRKLTPIVQQFQYQPNLPMLQMMRC